jgi:hypothetical protein
MVKGSNNNPQNTTQQTIYIEEPELHRKPEVNSDALKG